MGHNIFVYGTLKKGGCNHYLLDDCEFIDRGRVWGCVLLDFGGYPGMFPANIKDRDTASVVGEVYYVPQAYWRDLRSRLDLLEKAYQDYLPVTIEVEGKGWVKECFTYLYMPTVRVEGIIEGGDWEVPSLVDATHPNANGGP
jgi:gamma-glutamylcyclotransferase (GGCT)/AIG2-like uncharacterized protein YtfP